MSKVKKFIKKIYDRNQLKNITYSEVENFLVNHLGYERGADRGSHFTFINTEYEEYLPYHLRVITIVRPHGGAGMSKMTIDTVIDAYECLKERGIV
ncbi:MAG: hypothetical protein PHV06_08845 [bacterium]|nr:hypothetical protein [bacterium]